MKLTRVQREVLIGTLLGDGYLEKQGRNVRFRVAHSEIQKSYLFWKYKIFRPLLTNSSPYLVKKKDNRTQREYRKWCIDSFTLPIFLEWYEKFYFQGKKIVPKGIKNLLRTPLTLAVWYMDDGGRRNDCNALRISVNSYEKNEVILLLEVLKENFGVKAKMHFQKLSSVIYIPSSEAKKFCKIIKKWIIPSMEYKLI